jgi:YHS domain-containing protein
MRNIALSLLLLSAVAGTAQVLTSDAAEARPIYLADDSQGIAVGGHDLTSYFSGNGVPAMGKASHTVEHAGARYLFASADNAAKFKADPASFLPQYGGHCAWAMSRGSLAPGDPKLYRVVDGKLYLNFNPSVQKTWLTDVPGFIAKADIKWRDVPDDAVFGE